MNKPLDSENNETPLLVFPPYMSRFLLVTFFLMIAVAMSASFAVLFMSSLDTRWVMAASVGSVLGFVVFNILVSRGLSIGVTVLKVLAVVCLAISLVSVFISGHVVLCAVSVLFAAVSLITIRGDKYREMFRYMQGVRELRQAKKTISGNTASVK